MFVFPAFRGATVVQLCDFKVESSIDDDIAKLLVFLN